MFMKQIAYAFVVIMVFLCILTSAEYIFPESDEYYLTNPSSNNYYYKYADLEGNIPFTTYEGFNSHLQTETHYYYSDYVDEVYGELINNDYQDEYLEPLINEIKSISGSSENQARIAISLVQHLDYDYDAYYSASDDWKYPYETLHAQKGVCSDKSILMAYMLGQLGYDVVIFEFDNENHSAIGIRTNSGYDFRDTGYAFIETTFPTIITYEPPEYMGSESGLTNPTYMIDLWDGTKTLNVKSDYNDARVMSRFDGRSQLSNAEYNQWLRMVKKYDIQIDE